MKNGAYLRAQIQISDRDRAPLLEIQRWMQRNGVDVKLYGQGSGRGSYRLYLAGSRTATLARLMLSDVASLARAAELRELVAFYERPVSDRKVASEEVAQGAG